MILENWNMFDCYYFLFLAPNCYTSSTYRPNSIAHLVFVGYVFVDVDIYSEMVLPQGIAGVFGYVHLLITYRKMFSEG